MREIIPFPLRADQIPDVTAVQEGLMRLVDVLGSVVLAIVFLPLFVLALMAIRATSPGPVIYKQERVGKRGKVFVMYKLRTMVCDAEQVWGLKPAEPLDERVTRVGRVLRAWRIDELPQLFNVLRGEMSLVGPRPENLVRVTEHEALRGVRLGVKPGITGLAQIRSLYDVKPEHKLKYDYLYIQRRCVWLNVAILLRTIPVVIQKSGW